MNGTYHRFFHSNHWYLCIICNPSASLFKKEQPSSPDGESPLEIVETNEDFGSDFSIAANEDHAQIQIGAEPPLTRICIFDSLGGKHKFRTVRILKRSVSPAVIG